LEFFFVQLRQLKMKRRKAFALGYLFDSFQDLGPPRPQKTNWCAVLLAFLSGVFFTLCSALVKGLKSIAPMELLVLRSSIQLAAMLPIVAFRGSNPFGPSGLRGLLALQVSHFNKANKTPSN